MLPKAPAERNARDDYAGSRGKQDEEAASEKSDGNTIVIGDTSDDETIDEDSLDKQNTAEAEPTSGTETSGDEAVPGAESASGAETAAGAETASGLSDEPQPGPDLERPRAQHVQHMLWGTLATRKLQYREGPGLAHGVQPRVWAVVRGVSTPSRGIPLAKQRLLWEHAAVAFHPEALVVPLNQLDENARKKACAAARHCFVALRHVLFHLDPKDVSNLRDPPPEMFCEISVKGILHQYAKLRDEVIPDLLRSCGPECLKVVAVNVRDKSGNCHHVLASRVKKTPASMRWSRLSGKMPRSRWVSAVPSGHLSKWTWVQGRRQRESSSTLRNRSTSRGYIPC